ncbi:hypothetical protein [Streptomyces sp. ML-6]|uniref:hypothetical protein n=1 Tax=Streptomyces sp. ML-6 TaxID=2982693 RepID=UPI0024BF2DF4|nr:hypothetical protein [Streptomyces sp. ML-6]MDK0525040.1 hypothetical protein [Streptomyces sp. ML-6]
MTTTPGTTPMPTTTHTDQVLADRCQSSGDYLAGILAAAMLDTAGTPTKLPELLFPGVDPTVVRQIWEAALPVGYRAGHLAAQPSWTPEALDRLRAALADAGYTAMAGKAARSASIHPPRHPADHEPLNLVGVRDGGHP